MTRNALSVDDRAVSIAVTHILTIGITTILITGLLVGGSGLLESEKDRATRTELRTIGNRMAEEISSAYYSAPDSDGARSVVRVSHPDYVAGENYKVRIAEGSDCSGPAIPDGSDAKCLVLSTPTGTDEVFVPLDPQISLDDDDPLPEVNGGSFYIVVEEVDDGAPDGDPEVDVTLQDEPPSPSLVPMPEVQR
jgi:hypothetical protein